MRCMRGEIVTKIEELEELISKVECTNPNM
jgi:hypothetical protein